MNFLDNMKGQKHPDNMNRKEMIQKIKSFKDHKDAASWWLKYACSKVSKSAFNKARYGE